MRYRLTLFSERDGVRSIELEAPSEAAAQQQASGPGVSVLSVRADRLWAPWGGGRSARFPLLAFTQELLALVRAGISLVEAVETLVEKEPAAGTRAILEQVLNDLRTGKTFSSALETHAAAFPPLYIAAVRASERTGNLPDALGRYVAYRVQIEAAARKAISALVYPSLLIGVGALVVLFLLVYVVPRFSQIFEDRMSEIPWLTQLLIHWGRLLNAHPWEALGILVCAGALIAFAASRPGAKLLALRVLRMVPRIGARAHLMQLARLYRTLGMLLRSGIPVVPALGMARDLMHADSLVALERATARVREGAPISDAMHEAGLTTPVAARMLRVGEQTGNMGEMMEHLAQIYDDDNARALELFTRTFEPVLMALIGLFIGAIVVLMYLPIFDLATNIQ